MIHLDYTEPMHKMILPWAIWPWNRCKSKVPEEGLRCELKRKHRDRHVAERGMYWIWWID